MMETMFCRQCSGTRVQILKLCWVRIDPDTGDEIVEVDWESDPGVFYPTSRWCLDCGAETSIDYVETPGSGAADG